MMAADAQKGMAGWNVRDSGELWRSSGRKHQHHHRRHPSPKLKDHVITQRGALSPSKAAAAAQHGLDRKANLRRQHFQGMHSPQQLRGPHVTACGKNPPQRPPRCKPSFSLSNAPTRNLTFEPAMLLPTAEEGKELLPNWKDLKRCNLIHQMKKVKAGAEKSCDQVQDCNSLPKADCSECTNLTEYQSTDCLNKEHNLFFKKDGTDGQTSGWLSIRNSGRRADDCDDTFLDSMFASQFGTTNFIDLKDSFELNASEFAQSVLSDGLYDNSQVDMNLQDLIGLENGDAIHNLSNYSSKEKDGKEASNSCLKGVHTKDHSTATQKENNKDCNITSLASSCESTDSILNPANEAGGLHSNYSGSDALNDQVVKKPYHWLESNVISVDHIEATEIHCEVKPTKKSINGTSEVQEFCTETLYINQLFSSKEETHTESFSSNTENFLHVNEARSPCIMSRQCISSVQDNSSPVVGNMPSMKDKLYRTTDKIPDLSCIMNQGTTSISNFTNDVPRKRRWPKICQNYSSALWNRHNVKSLPTNSSDSEESCKKSCETLALEPENPTAQKSFDGITFKACNGETANYDEDAKHESRIGYEMKMRDTERRANGKFAKEILIHVCEQLPKAFNEKKLQVDVLKRTNEQSDSSEDTSSLLTKQKTIPILPNKKRSLEIGPLPLQLNKADIPDLGALWHCQTHETKGVFQCSHELPSLVPRVSAKDSQSAGGNFAHLQGNVQNVTDEKSEPNQVSTGGLIDKSAFNPSWNLQRQAQQGHSAWREVTTLESSAETCRKEVEDEKPCAVVTEILPTCNTDQSPLIEKPDMLLEKMTVTIDPHPEQQNKGNLVLSQCTETREHLTIVSNHFNAHAKEKQLKMNDLEIFEGKLGDRSSLSSEKLFSILSFLKQVEQNSLQQACDLSGGLQLCKLTSCSSTGSHSPRTVLELEDSVSLTDTNITSVSALSNPISVQSAAVSLCEDSLNLLHQRPGTAITSFDGIRRKIQELKDKLVDRDSCIVQLEKDKDEIRAEKEREICLEKAKHDKEIQDQAIEYKKAIEHQLSLKTKILKDKEVLAEKCSSLAANFASAEFKCEEKVKVMKEQWAHDIKKQKEAWSAGEKSKREAWMEKKTKEIKETTIIGLEPHIESIHDSQKRELQKLKALHKDEILQQLQAQSTQHCKEIHKLREQLLKERDDLLDKERLSAHARMNEMADKYEQQALQQRIRITNNLQIQLDRAEATRREDKQYTQELLACFQKEVVEREELLKKQHENAIQDVLRKKEEELSALRAKMTLEIKKSQHYFDERVSQELQKKEEEIKDRCIEERNKEIELVIERMENEKDKLIVEYNQKDMIKIKELSEEKEKLSRELATSELQFTNLSKKASQEKMLVDEEQASSKGKIVSLQSEISSQATVINKLHDQINCERQKHKLEEEKFELIIKQKQELLQELLANLRTCQLENDEIKTRKISDLVEVEARVKQTIEQKDIVIVELKEQLRHAHVQIIHTELFLHDDQNKLSCVI